MEPQELSDEEMSNVSGAGNPFADVKRVELNPIDEDLRNRI